jgi:hypothetical protein
VNLVVQFIEDRRLGLAGLGALAIAVGSVLPWIRVSLPLVGIVTGYGLTDDGKVTIVLGLLALALIVAYARLRHRDLAVAAALAGMAATGFAAAFIADLPRNGAEVLARLLAGNDAPIDPNQVASRAAQTGVGVYVIFAGTVVLVLACAALTIRSRGTSEPAPQSSA